MRKVCLPLPESGDGAWALFDGEGEPRVAESRLLGLVVDVEDLAVREDLPVPAERKLGRHSLPALGPRVVPLGRLTLTVGVVHLRKDISFRYKHLFKQSKLLIGR